jgi:hypothetical protein
VSRSGLRRWPRQNRYRSTVASSRGPARTISPAWAAHRRTRSGDTNGRCRTCLACLPAAVVPVGLAGIAVTPSFGAFAPNDRQHREVYGMGHSGDMAQAGGFRLVTSNWLCECRYDRPRRWSGALDRPRRVLQPRDQRPVARPPRRRRPRPVRRAGAGARVRRPGRVGAPRADRLNPRSPVLNSVSTQGRTRWMSPNSCQW